jgi:hypothetical protein
MPHLDMFSDGDMEDLCLETAIRRLIGLLTKNSPYVIPGIIMTL